VVIVYRYNLTYDPEPPPHVKRLWAWREDPRLGDRWFRRPCRRKGYQYWRPRQMDHGERRRARRRRVFIVDMQGRRMHRRGYRWRHGAWTCIRATGGRGHYHWTDTDKSREWGPFRGAVFAADLDAMRRLHTRPKRARKWRKWR
jgi:hypothetical protein